MSNLPPCWTHNGVLIFHELDPRGYLSKGFRIEPPTLTYSDDAYRNEWKDRTRSLLRTLSPSDRLQIQWSVSSDFRSTLDYYDTVTYPVTNPWIRHYRTQKANLYRGAMVAKRLRKEMTTLWLSRRVQKQTPKTLSRNQLVDHYEKLLTEYANEFDYFGQRLNALLGPMGTRLIPMTDADNVRTIAHWFNPSYSKRENFDPISLHSPNRSLQETYWCSAAQSTRAPFGKPLPYGFYHDGHYYNVLTLAKQPDDTEPGILDRLTTLSPDLDYLITLNVFPKDRKATIKKLERIAHRLEGDIKSEGRQSLRAEWTRILSRIDQLSTGSLQPYDFQFIITLWADNLEELTAKTLRIKTSINEMRAAQYQEPLLAATCKNLWFQTFPGNCFGAYKHHIISDATDEWLADLLPLSATFLGRNDEPEALFDGPNGQIVGVKTFINGTPQPGILFGMPGAGKSLFMIDLFTQTDPYFGYTAIVEEGLSFGIFTQLKNEEPTIITPDGTLTINPFDTLQIPLTPTHINSCVGILARMVGLPDDPDKANDIMALLTHYVQELFTGQWEDWMRYHKQDEPTFVRQALTMQHLRNTVMPPGSTFLEAWTEFRDRFNNNDPETVEYYHKISEAEISQFLKQPETELLVRNVSYAAFKPEEYPTLAMLVEYLAHDNNPKAKAIAPRLEQWLAYGPNGKLFDGVTTANLKRTHDHFELGRIDNSATQFKGVVGFLIFNYIRNKIVSLPRSVRKRMLFEEFARTLDLPGDEGKKTAEEAWAQLRKFNGWPFAIIQNNAQFKNSPVRDIIVSTSKMFFFLKQRNRADLDDVSQNIPLPEISKTLIQNFPLPESLPAHNRYSSILYYQDDALRPMIGTMRNYASPDILYVASTTGDDYEKRIKTLKQHSNLLEGILNKIKPHQR